MSELQICDENNAPISGGRLKEWEHYYALCTDANSLLVGGSMVAPLLGSKLFDIHLPLCARLLWAGTPGDTKLKLAAKAKELNEQLNTARDSEFEQKLQQSFRYHKLGERVQRMLRELRSDGFASFG